MRPLLVILLSLITVFSAQAQSTEAMTVKILETPPKKTMSQTILDIAQQFLGKPYVAHTLEQTPENLVCNLDEFDCYTLVENVLALALTKHNPDCGFDAYREYLRFLRYRDGVIDGYASRIHYFTDWARQAVENELLTDISKEIGEPQGKVINFMSQNRKLYPSIANDEEEFKGIKEAEVELNKQKIYFVPKARFQSVESKIQDGDIIAFASTVKGLDVNHEGFAIRLNGKLHLLHASSEENKVIISTETLAQYLNRIQKHSGVMVYRAID